MARYCCIPKCHNSNKKKKCFHIPKTKMVQKIWLDRIGRPDLKSLFQSTGRLDYHLVCEEHFRAECFGPNKKLTKFSLPTLKLPEYCADENSRDTFSLYEICAQKDGSSHAQPSTSRLEVVEGEGLDTQPSSSSFYEVEIHTQKEGEKKEKRNTPKGTSGIKKINSSLRSMSHPRRARRRLTDADMYLVSQLKYLRAAEKKLRSRNMKLRDKMALLEKSNTIKIFNRVNRTTMNFFISQQHNQMLMKKGRRFSIDDKIFALALYKQGGRGYRYLSKIFSLPSKRTLTELLGNIPFECGVNSKIFESLGNSVGKLNRLDRFCVLMFDEVALSPGLSYNFSRDCIEGLVDMGSGKRRAELADHALVFMIKSVRGKWKQPLAFYFCQNSTPTSDLVSIIKDVVRHVRLAGLHVIATIWDQGSTNVVAINRLLTETKEYCLRNGMENRYQGYLIDEREIVHLYDPPHLLKGIRNALLTKDLYFCQEGIQKVASWSHIVALYNWSTSDAYSALPKLTDEHVIPHRIKKMKVKCAAQVFSRSVGTVLKLLAGVSNEVTSSSRYFIDPSATQTADALLFFDQLFDSINGRYENPPSYKPLVGVVKGNSPHTDFWHKSLPILESMSFKNNPSSDPIVTPSLKHFKFTIRGFLYIWQILKTEGFKSLAARNFNQDPLENFFSQIRSHGVRNVNPTCSSFISSLKSLLINNFLSPHSPGSNCEEDNTHNALDTLKNFILKKSKASHPVTRVEPPVYTVQQKFSNIDRDLATPYVAGYLAKKIMKNISKCSECLGIIEAYDDLPTNILIKAKTYPESKMVYPSRTFTSIFHEFSRQVFSTIPMKINMFNIKEEVIREICGKDIELLFCSAHTQIHKEFIEFGFKFILLFYIRTVNKILCGKKNLQNFSDPIMKMASEKYQKRRR